MYICSRKTIMQNILSVDRGYVGRRELWEGKIKCQGSCET